MDAPIPPPLADDDEDVNWALSTATALWGRGERAEALKWLRRAAEAASDANADARALELFKMAADISSRLTNPPPPGSIPAPPPPSLLPAIMADGPAPPARGASPEGSAKPGSAPPPSGRASVAP